jgi:hypothetical protein
MLCYCSGNLSGLHNRESLYPYAITPRKCGIVPDHHIMVGSKVLLNFYSTCGESVEHLQSA